MNRTCTRCHLEKPESEFYRYYSRPKAPLNGRCMPCCREVSMSYNRTRKSARQPAHVMTPMLYGSEFNAVAARFLRLKVIS